VAGRGDLVAGTLGDLIPSILEQCDAFIDIRESLPEIRLAIQPIELGLDCIHCLFACGVVADVQLWYS
jgi:hypothetical protein